jgi:hypothetical protein
LNVIPEVLDWILLPNLAFDLTLALSFCSALFSIFYTYSSLSRVFGPACVTELWSPAGADSY